VKLQATPKQGISSAAAERPLRASEHRKKKVLLNKKTIPITTSSSEEASIEDSSNSESTMQLLKGKDKKVSINSDDGSERWLYFITAAVHPVIFYLHLHVAHLLTDGLLRVASTRRSVTREHLLA
jgi:hypothetical protein